MSALGGHPCILHPFGYIPVVSSHLCLDQLHSWGFLSSKGVKILWSFFKVMIFFLTNFLHHDYYIYLGFRIRFIVNFLWISFQQFLYPWSHYFHRLHSPASTCLFIWWFSGTTSLGYLAFSTELPVRISPFGSSISPEMNECTSHVISFYDSFPLSDVRIVITNYTCIFHDVR